MLSSTTDALILSAPADYAVSPEPLRDGPEVSWLSRCRVGDNQGSDGACALFAFANWAEVMRGVSISDAEILEAYHEALAAEGRARGGLTFIAAYRYAEAAGWLPGTTGITIVRDLARLAEQPVLCGYEVYPPWNRVGKDGQIKGYAGQLVGYHAVLIVADGCIRDDARSIYIENSWGREWGWNGCARMSEAMHRKTCREMWAVV